MTAIKYLLGGEDIRKTLEGVSPAEIMEIMSKSATHFETSPFAKIIGTCLSISNMNNINAPIENNTPSGLKQPEQAAGH